MRCHSGSYGTPKRMMALITRSFQPITYSVIRVYDDPGNVIETHEHTGEYKE
jgi:hypothetical protein